MEKRWWVVQIAQVGHARNVYVGKVEATEMEMRKALGPYLDIEGNTVTVLSRPPKPNPALVVYGNPRRNPSLVVYGNPLAVHGPSQLIGTAEELRYGWHGEWFKHPFESDVTVLGVKGVRGERQIVLVGMEGQPLWATDAELARGEVVT